MDQITSNKFIFTGRKGVGKSAIARYLKKISDNEDKSHVEILKISDINLEKLIHRDKHITSNSIFEWLILTTLIRLIVKNEYGEYTTQFSKLKDFLDRNSGSVGIDEYEFIEGTTDKSIDVNFNVLKHSFGSVFKKHFSSKLNKAPYYKLIPPLKEILKEVLAFDVLKNIEFMLLFDDLDLDFNINNKQDLDKIIELIRISKYYNNEFFENSYIRILLFLRDDMRDIIIPKYSDSAKIFNSYEIPINWYSDNYSQNIAPLKELIDLRIKENFKNNNINAIGNCWNYLFGNCLKPKITFKKILDFTFYRPRDLITFLSSMNGKDYTYPLNDSDLDSLLKEYINKNINELKSELNIHFNEEEIQNVFNKIFKELATHSKTFSRDDVLKLINDNLENRDPNIILELLSKYNLIIRKDPATNYIYFNYRSNFYLSKLNEKDLTYTIPKSLFHFYNPL